MKKILGTALAGVALVAGSLPVVAADLDIRIQNLTRGVYFTSILAAAHPYDAGLFSSGQPASANLQMMAEGGDISGLAADLEAVSATISTNPAGGLLGPGAYTSTNLNTDDAAANTHLSAQVHFPPDAGRW